MNIHLAFWTLHSLFPETVKKRATVIAERWSFVIVFYKSVRHVMFETYRDCGWTFFNFLTSFLNFQLHSSRHLKEHLKHLNTGTPPPNNILWTTQVQIWHWYPCLLKNSLQWQQYICWRPIRRFDNLYLQRARKPHHVVVQSLLKEMFCNLKNLRIALVLRINQYYRIAELHVNILWYQYHK